MTNAYKVIAIWGTKSELQNEIAGGIIDLSIKRFEKAKNDMKEQAGETAIIDAFKSYHAAVQNQSFPAKEHTFQVEL